MESRMCGIDGLIERHSGPAPEIAAILLRFFTLS